MHVCVCVCVCLGVCVCVGVCVCAFVHAWACATVKSPATQSKAGVDRYEPDWAASFSWKLQRMHYNSGSHWRGMWHELQAKLRLVQPWQAPAHISTAMWCVAWGWVGGVGGVQERKGGVHYQWTPGTVLTQRLKWEKWRQKKEMCCIQIILFINHKWTTTNPVTVKSHHHSKHSNFTAVPLKTKRVLLAAACWAFSQIHEVSQHMEMKCHGVMSVAWRIQDLWGCY